MGQSGAASTAAGGPLSLIARPWFWVLAIGTLWLLPLVKSLGAELPDPLPGMDGVPVVLQGQAENGEQVSLANLEGYLVLATSASLADGAATNRALTELRKIRKRMRGLGSSVVYLVLLLDAELAEMGPLLDSNGLRKPTEVFLLDPEGQALEALRAASGPVLGEGEGAPVYFLIDTRGRMRGAYGRATAALDRMILDTGQIANWRASDPPIGEKLAE